MRYAQIDKNGIVIAESQLSGIVNVPHMIEIPEGFDAFGKKYIDGEWITLPVVPPKVQVPTPSNEKLTALIADMEMLKPIIDDAVLRGVL